MKRLIVVAGHAIPRRLDALNRADGWYLKSFQAGEGSFFLNHIRLGAALAAADRDACLIYAGGQSDEAAGPRSEGQGYWIVADAFNWFGHPEVRSRATTEEFSMDSFENLLFGICRFRELTGRYPEAVTAVGWEFKSVRFGMHREAIRYPAARFRYVGDGNPPKLAESEHFEAIRRELFRRDPYGKGHEAQTKRMARNFSQRRHGYERSCPEIAGLLEHAGPEFYTGTLPWTDLP